MDCPSCNLKLPLGMGRVAEMLMERFRLNGFCITLEGLKTFMDLFVEHFGEICEEDVDELCHFVEKNFNTRMIDVELVKTYFKGFD